MFNWLNKQLTFVDKKSLKNHVLSCETWLTDENVWYTAVSMGQNKKIVKIYKFTTCFVFSAVCWHLRGIFYSSTEEEITILHSNTILRLDKLDYEVLKYLVASLLRTSLYTIYL